METPPPSAVRWYGRTDSGRIRPRNEDAFLGLQIVGRETHRLGKVGEADLATADLIFAVSDGVGGAAAGEYASGIAVDKITTLLTRSVRPSAADLEAGAPEILGELFAQIHRALVSLGRSYDECAGMEATLTLAWLSPGRLHFAHIGDSRLYHLPGATGEIRQLTHDDTHVGWLLREGRITAYEARSHPGRNVLQKALGGGHQFVSPQVGAVACRPGDTFLLCTDGLMEGLYDHHLTDILQSPASSRADADLAGRLVTASLENDGRDNVTALVVQFLS